MSGDAKKTKGSVTVTNCDSLEYSVPVSTNENGNENQETIFSACNVEVKRHKLPVTALEGERLGASSGPFHTKVDELDRKRETGSWCHFRNKVTCIREIFRKLEEMNGSEG